MALLALLRRCSLDVRAAVGPSPLRLPAPDAGTADLPGPGHDRPGRPWAVGAADHAGRPPLRGRVSHAAGLHGDAARRLQRLGTVLSDRSGSPGRPGRRAGEPPGTAARFGRRRDPPGPEPLEEAAPHRRGAPVDARTGPLDA